MWQVLLQQACFLVSTLLPSKLWNCLTQSSSSHMGAKYHHFHRFGNSRKQGFGIDLVNIFALGVSLLTCNRNAAARAFQQSHWPDLLRTDSVIKRGVRLDILLLTRLMTLTGGLIAIAGVVTPLGLYQDLQPSKNIETPFRKLI